MNNTYRVLITGLSDGFTESQVNKNLSVLFKVSADKLPNVFTQPAYIVKKNLDMDTAKKYQSLIQQQGCICVIESEQNINLTFDDLSESIPTKSNRNHNDNKAVSEQINTNHREFKVCGVCNFQLPITAKFCRGCGSAQSTESKQVNQLKAETKQDKVELPNAETANQFGTATKETFRAKSLEDSPTRPPLNSQQINNATPFEKSPKFKVIALFIFVTVLAGIGFSIWKNNNSFNTSSSNAPETNQIQTPNIDNPSLEYIDESTDTVAGKFVIRFYKDSNVNYKIFLNGKEIINCGKQLCGSDFYSINVDKSFSINGKTVLLIGYGDGGNVCEGLFGFFTINPDGTYQSSDSDIGNCASLSEGSVVQSGTKIILSLPTAENGRSYKEVWTYEDGKVTGPVTDQKSELNLQVKELETITSGDDVHNIVSGEVINENDNYYLNLNNSKSIVNLTNDQREDARHGSIVDRLEILFRFTENMELAPKLGKGTYDISIKCGTGRCVILRIEPYKTPLDSTNNSISSQFQGVWADPKGCKNHKAGIEFDPGAEITSDHINRYEHSCALIKTVTSSATTFSGEFSCSQDGETTNENISLILQPDGKLAGVSSNLLPKCN